MQQYPCPIRFRLLAALTAVSFIAFLAPVYAEKADRDKEAVLNADDAQGNTDNRTYNLKGNVIITKGTLLVKSDVADIREDPQGFQYMVATATAGKTVFYKQRRDPVAGQPEEFIEATSDKMEYDGKLDTVTLTGNAVVKRLKEGKPTDESIGSTIVINNLTGAFSVAGGALVTPENPKGRAQFILAPRKDAGAAKPEPKAEPAKLKPSAEATGAPK